MIKKIKQFNITTTTLSLSEFPELSEPAKLALLYDKSSMLKSLTNLVNVTQSELDVNISFLNQYKMVLDESSIVSKTDTEGLIIYVNDAFCKISGYSRNELIGQEHIVLLTV